MTQVRFCQGTKRKLISRLKGGTDCMFIKKDEAPPHVQASVWDIFKLIMAILNRASHHPQGYGKEGLLSED